MVSFQCHACGDVVKKPKLDHHGSRCHAGFDCIDCSTTFNTPADYKGHISCISEAEKYQKSLYKGPTKGTPAPKNNYPSLSAGNDAPHRPHWSSASRGGYGGAGGWGRPRTMATGANDTPLGTSTASPITTPIAQSGPQELEKPVVHTPAGLAGAEIPLSTEVNKKKRVRTRKSRAREGDANKMDDGNDDVPANKKTKIDKESEKVDPASIPLPQSPAKKTAKKTAGDDPSFFDKGKGDKRKSVVADGDAIKSENLNDVEKPGKKAKGQDLGSVDFVVIDKQNDKKRKSRKSKKEKKEGKGNSEKKKQEESTASNQDNEGVAVSTPAGEEAKGGGQEQVANGEDVEMGAPVGGETAEKKGKKRRRKGKKEQGQDVDAEAKSNERLEKRKRDVMEGLESAAEAPGSVQTKKTKRPKGDAVEVDAEKMVNSKEEKKRKERKSKGKNQKDSEAVAVSVQ